MNNKRCVLFAEPSKSTKLNLGTIKELTGDGDINTRGLYQNETSVRLPVTLLFECNKKPLIDGHIDNSAIRRFINIFFPANYTNDPKKLSLPNYHQANPEYKTESWQERYKHALFGYLMRYDYIDIVEPESIKRATMDYLLENDDLNIFMSKYFEETDDEHDFVSIQTMTKLYKEDFIVNKRSKEYRNMNKKRFTEMLQENEFWKHKYNQNHRDRYQGGGLNVLNVLLRMKRRNEDLEEISD